MATSRLITNVDFLTKWKTTGESQPLLRQSLRQPPLGELANEPRWIEEPIMDRRDYFPSSPFYRFGMALLASPVNGVALRERLAADAQIPPGGKIRLRFPEGVAEPPIGDLDVAEAIRRFAAHYPAYLADAKLAPEWVAEFAVVVIRNASGRLRFRAEIRNSMGRWLLVQLVFAEQRSAEQPSQSATNGPDSHAT